MITPGRAAERAAGESLLEKLSCRQRITPRRHEKEDFCKCHCQVLCGMVEVVAVSAGFQGLRIQEHFAVEPTRNAEWGVRGPQEKS